MRRACKPELLVEDERDVIGAEHLPWAPAGAGPHPARRASRTPSPPQPPATARPAPAQPTTMHTLQVPAWSNESWHVSPRIHCDRQACQEFFVCSARTKGPDDVHWRARRLTSALLPACAGALTTGRACLGKDRRPSDSCRSRRTPGSTLHTSVRRNTCRCDSPCPAQQMLCRLLRKPP